MWKYFAVVTIPLFIAWIYLKVTSNDDFASNIGAEVTGKAVLITGASSGIGEQLAYLYSRLGASVFITARRGDQLKKVIEKCRSLGTEGARYGYFVADMENYEVAAPNVIKEAVATLGGLDHLVLNHAFMRDFETWQSSKEDLRVFKKMMDTNVLSFVHLYSYAIPYLKKSSSGGKVAVVSALLGKITMTHMAAYSSSKFALDGFFSSVRQELRSDNENVTITLCVLGHIDTQTGIYMFQRLEEKLDVDPNKMMEFFTPVTVEETAQEILKSTVKGDRELYYPPLFGSQFLTSLLPVIRHFFPTLLDTDMEYFKKM